MFKFTNSSALYLIIVVFILLSVFSNIIDVLNFKTFARFLQLGSMGVCSLLVWNFEISYEEGLRKQVNRIAGILVIYVIIRFIIELLLIKNTDSKLIFISFSQFFIMYFWIYVASRISQDVLHRILKVVEKLFWFGIIFCVIEFLIPDHIKSSILILIFKGVIPESYFSRDLQYTESMRLGSFYLSPLTLSFTCLFLLCYYKVDGFVKKKWLFTAFITVLAKTKSSLMGGILFFAGRYSRILNNVLFIVILAIILITPCMFSGWDFYSDYDDTAFKSTANHLAGLVFGLRSAIENPFWGNGMGTSGYLVYLETITSPGSFKSPFVSEIPHQNGNESALGVIGYQMGAFFLILHLGLFFRLFKFQMENRNYVIATFILLSLLFQLLTESSLTVLVSVTQAFLFCKTINFNDGSENEN